MVTPCKAGDPMQASYEVRIEDPAGQTMQEQRDGQRAVPYALRQGQVGERPLELQAWEVREVAARQDGGAVRGVAQGRGAAASSGGDRAPRCSHRGCAGEGG